MVHVLPAMSREGELGVGRGAVLVLSPAQSRVAVGLVMRKTPAEIAIESGRGQCTVRDQMKQAWEK